MSDGATAPGSPSREDHQATLDTLRRAVAKVCPADLRSSAEDLVQAAALRLLETQRGEQDHIPPASYLWRVAFSAVMDEVRRRRRRPTIPMDGLTEETLDAGQGLAAASPPVPGLQEALRDCLSRLVEARRSAVVLHLHGYTAGESAQVLGWNEKRVYNATHRGLASLRECLEAKGMTP